MRYKKVISPEAHSLDHGLSGKSVPGSHVEDASLVNGQVADQAEAVDCLVAVDRHCVDKGSEAQAVAQSEGDNACAGQQRLCCHIHNWHLQQTFIPINQQYIQQTLPLPQHRYQ